MPVRPNFLQLVPLILAGLTACAVPSTGLNADSSENGSIASDHEVGEVAIDCPLRESGYSEGTPLIDLLINKRTREVISRELPAGQLERMPFFANIEPPTAAAIISLEQFVELLGLPPDSSDRIVASVSNIDPTEEEKEARCARYDVEVPNFSHGSGRVRILVFEKITGYFHDAGAAAVRATFKDMAKENDWSIEHTDLAGAINPETLSQFDVVVWNQISGDALTLTQRQALRTFLEGGGGFIGVHGSGGDFIYLWDWYADELLGARFAGHTNSPQFQEARVATVEANHPIAQGLPEEWTMSDEWYAFENDPRASGATVIASVDTETFSPFHRPGQQAAELGEQPIAWAKCVGKGKMFYSAMGHRAETFQQSEYRLMLSNAVEWAAKRDCG